MGFEGCSPGPIVDRSAIPVFARETFDLGREELAVGDRLSIGIYSPERTLIGHHGDIALLGLNMRDGLKMKVRLRQVAA